MSFYKVEGITSGEEYILYVGENTVQAPGFTLLAEDKDSYTYPVDGWYWYDTDEDASLALGITIGGEEPNG